MSGNTHEEAAHWYREMLTAMYRALEQKVDYNYDFERFGYGQEMVFDTARHAHFLMLFSENYARYYASRVLLADARSRELFDLLLLFRLVGHTHLRLPLSNPEYWKARDGVKNFRVGMAQESGLFGPLSIFRFKVGSEHEVKLKCWEGNVFGSFVLRQYYLDREDVKIRPEPGDTILDLGACFGDTAIAFALSAGASGLVHSFEFMPLHMKIVRDNLECNPAVRDRVRVHEVAVGAADSTPSSESPLDPRAIHPGAVADPATAPVRSIDSLARAGEIERVNFIKMDIEGYELPALKGAEETLRKYRPRLAISIYHKLDDFITIPQFIQSLQLGYRFYIDHYTIFSEETVLYAIAR
jgi:FkbM family methyltransferase